MDWWILELITVGALIAALLVLGPLIKRYGRSYAADVFRANPRTGKSYIVLMMWRTTSSSLRSFCLLPGSSPTPGGPTPWELPSS